jgi:hypothetical protein
MGLRRVLSLAVGRSMAGMRGPVILGWSGAVVLRADFDFVQGLQQQFSHAEEGQKLIEDRVGWDCSTRTTDARAGLTTERRRASVFAENAWRESWGTCGRPLEASHRCVSLSR